MITHDAIDPADGRNRALGFLAVALAVLFATTPPAAAQISGASASTSGSTGNSGDSDGSRRSSVAIQINDGTTLKTRFAWNLSSDVGIFSTRDTNGNAQHNVSFNATAPGAYFLDVDTQRTGDMNRINDASGCDGDVDVSSVSGGQSGGTITSGSLGLADPGSIPDGGSTVSGPFNQTGSARIDDTSNGVAQANLADVHLERQHAQQLLRSGGAHRRGQQRERLRRLRLSRQPGANGHKRRPLRHRDADQSLRQRRRGFGAGRAVRYRDRRQRVLQLDLSFPHLGRPVSCVGRRVRRGGELHGRQRDVSGERLPRSAVGVPRVGGRMRHRRGVPRQQRQLPCQ